MGIMQGLDAVGWERVPIVVCETEGASSFSKSFESGRVVELDRIDSIATSLGSKVVSGDVVAAAVSRGPERIRPFVTTDQKAVEGCVALANDERLLVEPACGVTLAYLEENAEGLHGQSIVLEVCGGSNISLPILQQYCTAFDVPISRSVGDAFSL